MTSSKIAKAKDYIQSAYALGTEAKAITENKPFCLPGDSLPKLIMRHDARKLWYDDKQIAIVVLDMPCWTRGRGAT